MQKKEGHIASEFPQLGARAGGAGDAGKASGAKNAGGEHMEKVERELREVKEMLQQLQQPCLGVPQEVSHPGTARANVAGTQKNQDRPGQYHPRGASSESPSSSSDSPRTQSKDWALRHPREPRRQSRDGDRHRRRTGVSDPRLGEIPGARGPGTNGPSRGISPLHRPLGHNSDRLDEMPRHGGRSSSGSRRGTSRSGDRRRA